jgi:hypothetical protein
MFRHGEFALSPPRTNKTPDLRCAPQAGRRNWTGQEGAREAVTVAVDVSATLPVSARVGPAAPSRAAASSHLRSSTAARGYRGAAPLSADADLSPLVLPRPDKPARMRTGAPSSVVPTCQLLGTPTRAASDSDPAGVLRGPSRARVTAFPGYAATLGPRVRRCRCRCRDLVRAVASSPVVGCFLAAALLRPDAPVACAACLLACSRRCETDQRQPRWA